MIMGGDRVQTGSAALWSISRVQHQSRSRGDDGVRLRAFSHAARNDDLPLQIRQPSQQSLLLGPTPPLVLPPAPPVPPPRCSHWALVMGFDSSLLS